MVVCGLFGFLNERIAYRPLRNAPRIASLITAIGVSFLLEYGGQFVFGADPKFFPTLVEKHLINFGGVTTTNYQLIVLVVAVDLHGAAAVHHLRHEVRPGHARRLVQLRDRLADGHPHRPRHLDDLHHRLVLAAVAGILYGLSYPKIDPLMGIMPGLKAFVAAVLGGIGNVPGAVVGGLIIGIIESFVGGSQFSNYRDAIAFIILIADPALPAVGPVRQSTRRRRSDRSRSDAKVEWASRAAAGSNIAFSFALTLTGR